MDKRNKTKIAKLTTLKLEKKQAKNFNLSRECTIMLDNYPESKEEMVVKFEELEKKELLGKGHFGTVIKMLHKPSNQTFAVKMIEESQMEANDSKNEDMDLKALLKIGNQCSSLIKFYGAIHAESAIWILTEEMDTSLDRFYSKVFALYKEMPELFISKVAHAVSKALYFMKQIKMIHRDIKPSNILLNYTGEIKLCDLGISGFAQNSVCMTFEKGCQSYMAPEKIDTSMTGGQHSIKSDIWSLGISLIEISTGYHPFNGSSELLTLIKVIVSKNPPKLDETKFSAELCNLVENCLFKWPDERISCSELLEHEFIKKYIEYPNDLEFIKSIIDDIDEDLEDF